MLKIKDDVTYQKLIGIGFHVNNWDGCYDYEYGEDVTIAIYKESREVWTYIEEYTGEYRELAVDEPTTIEQLESWCPKLIPLVEKVGDNQ